MNPPSARFAFRRPPARAWVPLLALAFGIAAAFIAAPLATQAPKPQYNYPGPVIPSSVVVALLVMAAFGGVVALRLLSPIGSASNRFVLQAAVILLLLLVFAVVTRAITSGGLDWSWVPGVAPPPSSSNGNPPPGCVSCNNTTPPLPGPPNPSQTAAFYATIIAVGGVLAAVLLIPYWLARRELSGDGEPATVEGARRAVAEALQRLEQSDDAREVVIALYGRWLRLLGKGLGDLEPLTPREIERSAIESLGLGTAAAHQLTEIFELARYTTRPLSVTEVARCRVALATVAGQLEARAAAAAVPPIPAPPA